MTEQKQDEFSNPYADETFGKTEADDELAASRDFNFKLKSGEKKVIRMVSPKIEAKIHWKVIPGAGRVVCRKTAGKDKECPICDYLEQTRAKEGWASWRCYTQIIDYTDGRVKQWDFSFATKEAIFDAIRNSDKVSVKNPLNKFKVLVERIGERFDTIYKITIGKAPSEPTEEEKVLVAEMRSITDDFRVLSVEEVRGLITGESTSAIREVTPTVAQVVPDQEVKVETKSKAKKVESIKDEDLF